MPHAGGGLPKTAWRDCPGDPFAPRRWGSTVVDHQGVGRLVGCPTPVGVYRIPSSSCTTMPRLPHAGGGLPTKRPTASGTNTVAPRRWGSTEIGRIHQRRLRGCPTPVGVYWMGQPHHRPRGGCPTPVGVYRLPGKAAGETWRLPHAGGGLPLGPGLSLFRPGVAPRRWGLPRKRRPGQDRMMVAPRRWGSTDMPLAARALEEGCPTPVGVYPDNRLP